MNTENNDANLSAFKRWALKNPEKLKASRRSWYEANKQTEQYKLNKKEYNKRYYLNKKAKNTTENNIIDSGTESN